MKVQAFILAGGRGSRLDILSEKRVKPAVPFAGKYRIIDFTLSNCANSGIYDIGILTQYLPFSLNEHIGSGKPWDMDRRDTQLSLMQPHKNWYKGTADALKQNIEALHRSKADLVLILSGDHIYKMDYRLMIDHHLKLNADVTLAVQPVPKEDISRFGILETDAHSKITAFLEKPEKADSNLASMGIYVFNKDILIEALETFEEEDLDFGKHIIPAYVDSKTCVAYTFNDYWKDVGTYDAYLEANLELTETVDKIPLDMYDSNWKIYTRSEEMPAVKVGSKATIRQALISNGSIIAGHVEKSVISPGVIIHPTAIVRHSVILNDTVIEAGAVIDHAIIDKNVRVEENAVVGQGPTDVPNQDKPDILFSGLNVLGKGVIVKANSIIERNCRIYPNQIVKGTLKAGSTMK
jgi:glucose-1-phosphate adenylyltransferase